MNINKRANQQGGFVWAIVLIVAIIIILVAWSRKGGSENMQDTATTTDSTTVSSQSADANVTPKTTKTTTAKPVVPPTPTRTASGAYIIKYTSTGFAPASLSITTGSSVRFTNNAAAAMRISPADKTNPLYSSLSQSKSVGTGGTFDYTFVSPGVYGYYNDNNLKHTGIIVVHQ